MPFGNRKKCPLLLPGLLAFALSIPVQAMPVTYSRGLCASLLSRTEIAKSEGLFRSTIVSRLDRLQNPRVKIIWGANTAEHMKLAIRSAQIYPGLWSERISDLAIPQIPIPEPRKDLPLTLLTQSDEEKDSARVPSITSFNLKSRAFEDGFSLVAKAGPRLSTDAHMYLRVNEFVINTLVALSTAPFVNLVLFRDRVRQDDRDQVRRTIFHKIVERKTSRLSDRETLKDLYREQEDLVLIVPPGLSLEQISIRGYRFDGNKARPELNLSRAHEIRVSYRFRISH